MMSRLCVTSRLQKQRGEAIITHWGPPTQCAFYENSARRTKQAWEEMANQKRFAPQTLLWAAWSSLNRPVSTLISLLTDGCFKCRKTNVHNQIDRNPWLSGSFPVGCCGHQLEYVAAPVPEDPVRGRTTESWAWAGSSGEATGGA